MNCKFVVYTLTVAVLTSLTPLAASGAGATFGTGDNEFTIEGQRGGGLRNYKNPREADHPVTYVTWNGAARFVNWLNTNRITVIQPAGTDDRGYCVVEVELLETP